MWRLRGAYFNRVLAPEGEILFFVLAKKSIQEKGRPDTPCLLRLSHLPGNIPGINQKVTSYCFGNTLYPYRVPKGYSRSMLLCSCAPVLLCGYACIFSRRKKLLQSSGLRERITSPVSGAWRINTPCVSNRCAAGNKTAWLRLLLNNLATWLIVDLHFKATAFLTPVCAS
jgi:hypothetical protein